MYMYTCEYTAIPFRALSGPAGCRGLPRLSQSLTLPAEGRYFPGRCRGKAVPRWSLGGLQMLPGMLFNAPRAIENT